MSSAAAFLAFAILAWPNTVDDALISCRYAAHLASGEGLVFNPGERVEGFSNPSWVLLLAGAGAARLPVLVAAKVLGIAAGLAVLGLMVRLARRLELDVRCTLGALALVATNVGFCFYAVAGLETLLYTLLVLLVAERAVSGNARGAGWAAAACAWTRPDGVVAAVALAGGLRGRHAARALRVFVLGVAALLLARWLYYGTLLPNTFHAKVPSTLAPLHLVESRVSAYLTYTWSFARDSLALGLLLPFCTIGWAGALRRPLLALALLVPALHLLPLASGGDWMSFSRFLVPSLPPSALLAFAGVAAVGRRLAPAAGRALTWAAVAAGVVASSAVTLDALARLRDDRDVNPAMHSRVHTRVGDWLAARGAAGERVVVNEIGAIGFRSGLHVVDMLGLTDRAIPVILAREDLDGYARHVLAGEPRFVLLNDRQRPGDVALHPLHDAIFRGMRANGRYELVERFALNDWKGLLVFERRP